MNEDAAFARESSSPQACLAFLASRGLTPQAARSYSYYRLLHKHLLRQSSLHFLGTNTVHFLPPLSTSAAASGPVSFALISGRGQTKMSLVSYDPTEGKNGQKTYST